MSEHTIWIVYVIVSAAALGAIVSEAAWLCSVTGIAFGFWSFVILFRTAVLRIRPEPTTPKAHP